MGDFNDTILGPPRQPQQIWHKMLEAGNLQTRLSHTPPTLIPEHSSCIRMVGVSMLHS